MTGTSRRRRTATTIAGALAVVGLAACSSSASDDARDDTGAAAAEASPSSQAPDDAPSVATQDAQAPAVTTTGLDPALAVERPGPRDPDDALGAADILALGQDDLDPDTIAQVEAMKGVQNATPIAVRQISIENRVYNVAAVDLADYRLFAPQQATPAALDEQLDRVARGEIAVDKSLKKQLPTDANDFAGLETPDGDQLPVHVGAWAPQVEQIDIVVNTEVGKRLGMTGPNGMLLYTGKTAPDTLRKPLADVLGGDVSVQNLDAVARYGLDTDAFQTAVLVGSFADAVGTYNYTPIGGGRIAPEPSWVRSHISTEVVPILGAVTCNNAIFPQLKAALAEIKSTGLADTIHPGEYAGCYYPRFIAGSTSLSNHSFGLALDLNTPGNQRGTVGEMDRGVVAIFKYWGFAWGGDWRYTDPMHFELNRIVRPG